MFLRLNSNQRLDKGQKLEVAGKGHLIMQTDGNLVVYDAANAPKWATGTQGKVVTHVIMQTDGNLVIYNNTAPVWASDTWNVGANGGYFQIDLNVWNGRIYKANDTVAKELFGTVATVVIQESTTLNVTIGSPTNQPLKFPRQQNWEAEICKALGMTGVGANYAALTEFQKAIGDMALSAAEVYFPANRKSTTTIQPAIPGFRRCPDRARGALLSGWAGDARQACLRRNACGVQRSRVPSSARQAAAPRHPCR